MLITNLLFCNMLTFTSNDEGVNADSMDQALCDSCGLSKFQRYSICGLLFVGGWLMSWLAFISLMNPTIFATYYTIGNIMAICSSFFLSGPCNQLKNMFKPARILATCVYLLMMALTLYVAFKNYPAGIVFLCAFIQFLAMLWYFITYIPYGQTMLKNCLCGCCKV